MSETEDLLVPILSDQALSMCLLYFSNLRYLIKMENYGLTGIIQEPYVRILHVNKKLGFIGDCVIIDGRLSFEDDLRS